MGSSPVASTIKYSTSLMCCIFLLFQRNATGLEGGSRFAGAKRFALRSLKMRDLTAKADVDNVGAGRAAKGASPVASTKNNG